MGIGDFLIAIAVQAPVALIIAVLWVNTLERQKNNPEWQKHKDDPDYWDWP